MTEETQVEQTTAPAQEQAPAAEQTQTAEAPPADLNISDLLALKSIVEIASQRAAFKANELEGVGRTYNKLSNFLDSVAKRESK